MFCQYSLVNLFISFNLYLSASKASVKRHASGE